jgi:KUP system potassium uptake protein
VSFLLPFHISKLKRAYFFWVFHHKGSEALFADLGHFNRSSIQVNIHIAFSALFYFLSIAYSTLLSNQIAFLLTIYPSLVLTYAGQTAYLIKNPNDHDDGFYKFIPTAIYWPIFIIATLAAIVASQSLISATFSVIKQSVALDYFPRVKVVHTSSNKEGEVYSPEVNYILMILCVAVILIFGDGKDIGNAFGMLNQYTQLSFDHIFNNHQLLSFCRSGFFSHHLSSCCYKF